jgi:hypothetical protein
MRPPRSRRLLPPGVAHLLPGAVSPLLSTAVALLLDREAPNGPRPQLSRGTSSHTSIETGAPNLASTTSRTRHQRITPPWPHAALNELLKLASTQRAATDIAAHAHGRPRTHRRPHGIHRPQILPGTPDGTPQTRGAPPIPARTCPRPPRGPSAGAPPQKARTTPHAPPGEKPRPARTRTRVRRPNPCGGGSNGSAHPPFCCLPLVSLSRARVRMSNTHRRWLGWASLARSCVRAQASQLASAPGQQRPIWALHRAGARTRPGTNTALTVAYTGRAGRCDRSLGQRTVGAGGRRPPRGAR